MVGLRIFIFNVHDINLNLELLCTFDWTGNAVYNRMGDAGKFVHLYWRSTVYCTWWESLNFLLWEIDRIHFRRYKMLSLLFRGLVFIKKFFINFAYFSIPANIQSVMIIGSGYRTHKIWLNLFLFILNPKQSEKTYYHQRCEIESKRKTLAVELFVFELANCARVLNRGI